MIASSTTPSSSKPPIIALFTYGGGIRGLIPANFMQRLEETTGLYMSDMFDVFTGPSTGSILNTAINIPHPYDPTKPKFKARHMVRFYEREGPQIFPADAFRSFRSLIHDFNNRTLQISQLNRLVKHGHYEHANLGRALRSLFGRTQLSESLKSLIVPVYNIRGHEGKEVGQPLTREGGHAVWLKNIKFDDNALLMPPADVSMFDAVMGSTAAPTYFPCHHFQLGTPLDENSNLIDVDAIDGSVFDNPCTTYYGALRDHIPADRDLILVIIGTGYCNRSYRKDDWDRFGSLGVVDPKHDMPLINIFFHSPETALHDTFYRDMYRHLFIFNKSMTTGAFMSDFPSSDIDDDSPENLRRLKNFFEMMLAENRKQFLDLCELLVSNYECKKSL
jgi:patatin-like phospholipase/acyl hydrolase